MTKIVFFGTPEFVIPVVKKLSENFEIVAVVTAPDAPKGRGNIISPSPVSEFAKDNGITIFKPEKLSEIKDDLEKLHPDLFVVAAYGKIISESILSIPNNGAINIHPSLLPKYRGPSPIQSALLHEDSTGISIIKMDEKMDHGPILSQWDYPLTGQDAFSGLHTAMFIDAADRLPKIITDYLSGALKPVPQNEEQATVCKMITKDDGFIDIKNPPEPKTLDRMIRAYYPWPAVWFKMHMNNSEVKIIKLLPENRIQIEGKNVVTMEEFFRGYPELKQQLQQLLGL